ncbi:MAG: glycosyltransferase family 2 protein [Desulfomonilaceae bacterium]|nr:glycosyltransferase family 2 protein [Desulfomonilaceae bacterium]
MRESCIDSVTFFYPVYNDEGTVRQVAMDARDMLSELGCRFDILIVNDGSQDRSGEIADRLAAEFDFIRVIHHPRNLGYGVALRTGMSNSSGEWICMIDGDRQYDVWDFQDLFKVAHHYDLIITFRYKKIYSNYRTFVSWVYNKVLRFLFITRFRDISTGLRMVRKHVVEDLDLVSTSPFIGAELAIKTYFKGYHVGEVGIQTFPRTFGKSTSTTPKNILATINDMWLTYRTIFSTSYQRRGNG